jgi:phenylacetate-coenzyme A ligase PaaK-like adenylate-forming protein
VPSDRAEWSTIIGSYGRASDWSGGKIKVYTRSKMAVVSSTTPWHQSSRVARSVRSPFAASVRYDANMPLPKLVSALNEQRPDILIGYASVLKMLAVEQLEGRLRIHPRSIDASSEVFATEARALVARAFGVQPFEVYAATETGGIAAECERHEGLHLFEDLLIVEPVDDAYRPVPIGEVAARTLVTVLHSRTLPLIRYELTDRIRLTTRRCSCALPFALIESVEGRSDDAISLPGADVHRVTVHPLLFERLLGDVAPAGWQVSVDDAGIVVRLRVGQVPEQLENRVREELVRMGVRSDIALRIDAVVDIPVGAAGKRPRFVRALAG